MKLPVVSWQLDHSYAQPHPLGLTEDDSKLPISAMFCKSNDGLAWMGDFDTHPLALRDIASVTKLVELYAEQGIGFTPWMVVQLRAPGRSIAAEEGSLAGRIAAASGGRMILDLEPHEVGPNGSVYYLRDDLGANLYDVRAFMAAFLTAGGREIHINPDARTGRMPTFAYWWAFNQVTKVLPQLYWPDFQVGWKAAIDNGLAVLKAAGVQQIENVRPMLPATATPADLTQAIRYCRDLGCEGVSLYQRGTLSPAVADAIAAMNDPWAAVPAPTPVLPASPTALEIIQTMRGDLDRLESVVRGG